MCVSVWLHHCSRVCTAGPDFPGLDENNCTSSTCGTAGTDAACYCEQSHSFPCADAPLAPAVDFADTANVGQHVGSRLRILSASAEIAGWGHRAALDAGFVFGKSKRIGTLASASRNCLRSGIAHDRGHHQSQIEKRADCHAQNTGLLARKLTAAARWT
jgi:hypothetical protein